MLRRLSIASFTTWMLLSCRTAETTSRPSESLTCEDQLKNLPEFQRRVEIEEKAKQAGGYILSYGATAAGYAADAVVLVAEGVVKTVIYCPAYAVSSALGHIPCITATQKSKGRNKRHSIRKKYL